MSDKNKARVSCCLHHITKMNPSNINRLINHNAMGRPRGVDAVAAANRLRNGIGVPLVPNTQPTRPEGTDVPALQSIVPHLFPPHTHATNRIMHLSVYTPFGVGIRINLDDDVGHSNQATLLHDVLSQYTVTMDDDTLLRVQEESMMLSHSDKPPKIEDLDNIFRFVADQEDAKQQCSIRQENFIVGEEIAEWPGCRHQFAAVELDQWLQRRDTCPNCRRDLSRGDDDD